MKALQATDFKWPYVCSVCLGCPASDTRDLGEKKKEDRGETEGMQQGVARWRARPSVQVSWLARCSLARAHLGSSPLIGSLGNAPGCGRCLGPLWLQRCASGGFPRLVGRGVCVFMGCGVAPLDQAAD